MLARDNIYFNAKEKLKATEKLLADQHENKFDQILKVFPYGSDEQGKATTTDMDEVIKKSSKIIARHGVSKWVDDAYFAMGQAQFFKRDLYGAIETFQFVSGKFKNSPLHYESILWIMKCYMYLDKPDEAEAVFTLLKTDKKFPEKLKGELNAIMAQIYIDQDKYRSAETCLEIALKSTRVRYKKYRYHYILAQLYQITKDYEKANLHFKKVIVLNPPYDMAFNAKINLAKAYNANGKNSSREIRKFLKSMLKDDKNISYYDQIYFELAELDLKDKNKPGAIKNYKLSAQTSVINKNQKALAFLSLANLFFDEPNYTLAQAYYDSTALFITPTHPDYKKIMEKKTYLTELIQYLMVVDEQDSLLQLSLLDKTRLLKKLDQWEKEDIKKKEELKNQQNDNNFVNTNSFQNNTNSTVMSNWVFDNPVAMGQGYNDFIKKFGTRPLTDNWRIAAKQQENLISNTQDNTQNDQSDNTDSLDNILSDPAFKDLSKFKKQILTRIPFTDEARKASKEKLAAAWIGMGVIYKEKLNDTVAALDAFQTATTQYTDFPGNDKAFFYLYKIYKDSRNTVESESAKNTLLTKYPTSDYTKLILDQGKPKEDEEDPKLMALYEATYNAWKAGNWSTVKTNREASMVNYPGNGLQPKFDYLYALSLAQNGNDTLYELALKDVAKNWAGTDVAVDASTKLEALNRFRLKRKEQLELEKNPPKQKLEFKFNASGKYYYYMAFTAETSPDDIKLKYSDYNKAHYADKSFSIQNYVIDNTNQLVLVKEFADMEAAMTYLNEISKDINFISSLAQIKVRHGIIDEPNFKLLIENQDIVGYEAFYLKTFNP